MQNSRSQKRQVIFLAKHFLVTSLYKLHTSAIRYLPGNPRKSRSPGSVWECLRIVLGLLADVCWNLNVSGVVFGCLDGCLGASGSYFFEERFKSLGKNRGRRPISFLLECFVFVLVFVYVCVFVISR